MEQIKCSNIDVSLLQGKTEHKCAKCTDVTGTVRSTNSHWEVSSKSFQKSGSTATGTATVKQLMSGKVVKTTTKKISIHCSPTGKIS